MIYVVRHGQTDLNKEGRLQGRKGLPLNRQGREQAEALKNELTHIRFDYVYSSPQERAVQTAELATGAAVIIDERLDVFDLGEADNRKRSEVTMAGVIPNPRLYKGVEDIQNFMKRVFEFMHQLQAKFKGSGATIMLSGHRCTTGCIGAYFEGIPADGNILKFSSDNGRFKVYPF
ncbi:histidine phosphatase family protein [Paenibacillus aurantius]|uniref:Histidine phosphatase family protein n=1 Tax=Paenibacillus aurantius TaxID=2918900 RepID=A0AA96LBM3_9BACL|nr:histidine phosphatase family protein [Paenibacillus aurantius]WNQ10959.1 histidine phosphatase family protein [Paenibacillus aurantius]